MSDSSKTSEAIILVAHGTRNIDDSNVIFRYSEDLQDLLQQAVYPGFGEMLEPSTAAALTNAIADGFTQIKVLPYFLFASTHVKRDLSETIQQFQQRHPEIQIKQCRPIEYDPRILQILIDRLNEEDI